MTLQVLLAFKFYESTARLILTEIIKHAISTVRD